MEAYKRLRSTIYYTNLMRWRNPLLELGNQVGSKQMYSLLIPFQPLNGIMSLSLETLQQLPYGDPEVSKSSQCKKITVSSIKLQFIMGARRFSQQPLKTVKANLSQNSDFFFCQSFPPFLCFISTSPGWNPRDRAGLGGHLLGRWSKSAWGALAGTWRIWVAPWWPLRCSGLRR